MVVVVDVLQQTWDLVLQAATFLLLGFALAGLLHTFLPVERVMRWLGARRFGTLVRAAAIGAPLPLCSCAVVPVAAALRKHGASRGATTAFLISTPETGIDSIAVTYALMDPLMTVARPVAAVGTAIAAGVVQNVWDAESDAADARDLAADCGSSECCDAKETPPESSCCGEPSGQNAGAACCSSAAHSDEGERNSILRRLRDGLRYGLVEMFEDLGIYLLVGFLAAGVLAVVLAEFDLRTALGSVWAPLIMLLAGIPLYVCAAAATPMIAVLVSEGLSPGAGLVFLLAGPATNAAALVVLNRVLGRRGVAVYLISIMTCALLAGYLTDAVYWLTGTAAQALTRADACRAAPSWADVACALGLTACVAYGLWLKYGRALIAGRRAVAD